jgi:hypothetical protein
MEKYYQRGTSKNRSYSSDATRLSANDSASFPFRFMDVHARAARDPHQEQFFEVPITVNKTAASATGKTRPCARPTDQTTTIVSA